MMEVASACTRLLVQLTYACEQEMRVWTVLNEFSATKREQCHQQLLAQISFLREEDAYKSLSAGHRAANCAPRYRIPGTGQLTSIRQIELTTKQIVRHEHTS